MERPNKDQYYWNIAKEVAQRGTCLSISFGCIIVKNDQIISTGYVGAPRGVKSCNERGYCLRRKHNIPSGTQYEVCASVHAEQNALINAARAGVSVINSTLYLFGEKIHDKENQLIDMFPCFICKKMIINAGIKRIVVNDSQGNLKIYYVGDWIREWQEHHLLEDKEKYDADYKSDNKDDLRNEYIDYSEKG